MLSEIRWSVALPSLLVSGIGGGFLGYHFGWLGVLFAILFGYVVGKLTVPFVLKDL